MMLDVDNQLNSEILTALISAGATLLAASIGFIAVIWQIGRQGRMAREQSRETDSQKLKLHVYQLTTSLVESASEAEVKLTGYVRHFLTELEAHNIAHPQIAERMPPKARIPDLLELHKQQAESAIELVRHIERWTIIDPRIKVFQWAFNSAMHDIQQSWIEYFQIALICMPITIDNTENQQQTFRWIKPNESRLKLLIGKSERMIEALNYLGSYIYDFEVELQNLLLNDLFNNKVEARQPLDPQQKVVRLDQYEELKSYFSRETAWGQHVMKIENSVRSEQTEGQSVL